MTSVCKHDPIKYYNCVILNYFEFKTAIIIQEEFKFKRCRNLKENF